MRLAVVGALVVAVAVTAAGCSSGRLSKADFSLKVNGLCATYEGRIQAATAKSGATPAGLAQAVDSVAPILREATAAFDRVRPPKELEPKYDLWQEGNRRELREIRALGAAARRNDRDAARRAALRIRAIEEDGNRVASELGLAACAR